MFINVREKLNDNIKNFVLFKDGKIVEQFMGAMPAEDFEDKLKKVV